MFQPGNDPLAKIRQLTDNVWQTSADNKLAAADTYKVKAGNIINSIENFKNKLSLDGNLLDQLKGGLAMVQSLQSTLQDASKLKDALTSGDLVSRIAQTPALLNAVTNVAGKAGLDLPSAMQGNFSQVADMAVKVAGVTQKVGGGNWSELSALGGVLTAATGKKDLFELIDPNAQLSFVSTTVKECLKQGVPNSWEALAGNLVSSNLGNQLASMVLPEVVKFTGQDVLSKIAEVSGFNVINTLYPNVLEDYAKNYLVNSAKKLDSKDRSQEYRSTVDTFGSVKPNWDQLDWNGSHPVMNLTPIAQGSDNWQEMLTSGIQETEVPKEKFYVLGLAFQPTTVESAISQYFPNTWIENPSQNSQPTVDPTVLAFS